MKKKLYSIPGLLLLALSFNPLVAQQPPNVVLFLVDDMGWMDSSAYGSEYYETPNMIRLSKQAMRFTDAHAVPLCSPTFKGGRTSPIALKYGIEGLSTAIFHY